MATVTKNESLHLDPLMVRLGHFIQHEIEQNDLQFKIQDKLLTSEEVSSPCGLLTILVYQAAQFYEQVTGYTLPLYYYGNDESLCNISPGTKEAKNNTFVAWAHFLHYAFEDWIFKYPDLIRKNEPIPLDDLYTKWHDASNRHELEFRPPPEAA